MNRVASRAMIAMVLVLILLGGMVFFLFEYAAKSDQWVMHSASPHVRENRDEGMILDSQGALLLDYTTSVLNPASYEDAQYAQNADLRKATLHWLGSRDGNVPSTLAQTYRENKVVYDKISGVYAYGEADGRIHLTLDSKLQKAALEALGDRRGTVAVYNYKTGALVCAVTTPTFDPDNVPDIIGDTTGAYTGAYTNRFTQGLYVPGSIFKIVTLAAALETLPDARELSFNCDGAYEMGVGVVKCEGVHGKQSLKQAFCNSCNCAFAQLVEKIGKERLQQYVELFGVTESFSFDGFTVRKGNFDLSDAYAEEIAWAGIGQYEDQIVPAAFLRFVGAIAAGGNGYDPYVVQKVTVGSTTTYEAAPKRQSTIMRPETAATVMEYMRNNVATKYGDENFPGFQVCAKTGTAQNGGGRKSNAMFTGFLLDEQHPYAFIVAVEEAGYGKTVCVPIVAALLKELE